MILKVKGGGGGVEYYTSISMVLVMLGLVKMNDPHPQVRLVRYTIVKFTQLCSKFLPTALLNFACYWLALDRDISFGRLTSPNV